MIYHNIQYQIIPTMTVCSCSFNQHNDKRMDEQSSNR